MTIVTLVTFYGFPHNYLSVRYQSVVGDLFRLRPLPLKYYGVPPAGLCSGPRVNERFCWSYASWRVPLDGARVSGLRCRVCLRCLGGSMKGLISIRSHTI